MLQFVTDTAFNNLSLTVIAFLWRLQLNEYCIHSCYQQILLPWLLCKQDSSIEKHLFLMKNLRPWALSITHQVSVPYGKIEMATLKESLISYLVQKKEVSKKLNTCLPVHQGFQSGWRWRVASNMFLFWKDMASFTGRAFPAWWLSNINLCVSEDHGRHNKNVFLDLEDKSWWQLFLCIFFCCSSQKLAFLALATTLKCFFKHNSFLHFEYIWNIYTFKVLHLFYYLRYGKSTGNLFNNFLLHLKSVEFREPKK